IIRWFTGGNEGVLCGLWAGHPPTPPPPRVNRFILSHLTPTKQNQHTQTNKTNFFCKRKTKYFYYKKKKNQKKKTKNNYLLIIL
ncbi:hypothetical protein ACVGXN_00505, partial [Enterobacter hormaechei]